MSIKRPLPPKETYDGPTPKGRKSKASAATTGRFRTLNSFWRAKDTGLNSSDRAVWMQLFVETDSRSGLVSLSQSEIAERLSITARAVRKILARLKSRGYISIAKQGSLRGGATTYKTHYPPKPQ